MHFPEHKSRVKTSTQPSPDNILWMVRETHQKKRAHARVRHACMHTHPRRHTHYYLSWYALWGTCLSSSSSSSVLLSTGSCLRFQIIPLCLSIDSRSPLPCSWFLDLCIPLPLFPHTFPPRTLTLAARLSPSHGVGLASELTGNSESSHDNQNPGRACVCARTSMRVCFVFEMGLRGICVCVCVFCLYDAVTSAASALLTNTHTQAHTKLNTHINLRHPK